jgi:hypothetical protein
MYLLARGSIPKVLNGKYYSPKNIYKIIKNFQKITSRRFIQEHNGRIANHSHSERKLTFVTTAILIKRSPIIDWKGEKRRIEINEKDKKRENMDILGQVCSHMG